MGVCQVPLDKAFIASLTSGKVSYILIHFIYSYSFYQSDRMLSVMTDKCVCLDKYSAELS